MHAPSPSSTPRTGQLPNMLAAVAGVIFALSLFFSLAMIDPLHSATDQELQTWWTDNGLLRDSVISMAFKLLAAMCFLVFVTQLRARLRVVAAEHFGVELVQAAGIIFVAALSIGSLPRALIALNVRSGDEPLPGPDMLRYATEFSDAVFGLVAIPFAALAILAASLLILRTNVFARWLGWLGLGVSALSLVMAAFMVGPFASPLILIWVLGASYQLIRTRGVQTATDTAAQPVLHDQIQPLAGRAS